MQNKKHNGWTNYATWRVKLELFEDSLYYREEGEVVEPEEIKESAYQAIIGYGEIPEDSIAVSYAMAFLNDVNWYEIAHSINEEIGLTECDDCGNWYPREEIKPYKMEEKTFLCEDCMDKRREEK